MRRHTRDMAFWSDSDDMRYSIPRIGPTILDISNDDFQLQRADKRDCFFLLTLVFISVAPKMLLSPSSHLLPQEI